MALASVDCGLNQQLKFQWDTVIENESASQLATRRPWQNIDSGAHVRSSKQRRPGGNVSRDIEY